MDPLPYPHPACMDVEDLLKQCRVTHHRSGGPGGSRRNKVETAVAIMHVPTGWLADASERRSAEENRRVALRRLRLLLALELRLPMDPLAATSALWKSRVRDRQIQVNPHHWDYPALLAEALDVAEACKEDLKTAAGILGCSMSQLVKFFKDEPRALEEINARRAQRGLHGYK